MVESTTSTPCYLLHIGLRAYGEIISFSKSSHFLPQEPEASIKTNGFHPEVEVEDPRIAPRLAPSQSLVAPSPQVHTRALFLFSITQNVGLPSSLISQPSTFRMSSMIPSLPPSQLPSLRFPLHLSLSLVLTSCRIPRLLSKAHFIPAFKLGSLNEELFQIFANLD